MTTRAESITEAIKTLLQATPTLADGNVWRSRLRPIPSGSDSAIVVRQGRDVRLNDATTIGHYTRQTVVMVEVYARGDVPDQLADTVVQSIVGRIMADTSLGGLCDDIMVGNKELDWSARDTDLVAIDIEFAAVYQLQVGEL